MNLEEYIADRMQRDSEFREAWEALRPEYEFRLAMIKARLAAGLTQAELAQRMGTKLPAIARLEAGQSQPTLDTLRKLARALGVSFEITPDATVQTHPTPPANHQRLTEERRSLQEYLLNGPDLSDLDLERDPKRCPDH